MKAKLPRVMQVMLVSILGLAGMASLIASIRSGARGGIGFAVFAFFIAFMAFAMFEIQIRGLRRKTARVKYAIESHAKTMFDRPAVVSPGYDLTVTLGPTMGGLISAMDMDTGFTANGEIEGVRAAIGSHVSTAGRQIGEMSHVYSYVAVDMKGFVAPFHLLKAGVGSSVGVATGLFVDATVGDKAFDDAWTVDADTALARAALDEATRARLMDLRRKVSLVSLDFAQGTMSVILTEKGLACRWPGELDRDTASEIARVLLDIRRRILAYVEREAAKTEGAGYRVVADASPESGEIAYAATSESRTSR